MSKKSELKFVGQPIFKQILNLVDAVNIQSLVRKHNSDCYYKAFLYKKRRGIELLFKKMKQNFQLHYFYGENENAIRTQVWCTLIAQLLLTVIQKIAQTKKAFSVVASLVRMHLISMLDVNELLRNTKREYQVVRGSPDGTLQLSLFGAVKGGGHF